MRTGLATGATDRLEWIVGPEHVVHLGGASVAGGVTVFSTPSMILLMERTARKVLAPYLEDHEASVGVRVEIEHLAGAPLAAKVHGEARVTAIEGRTVDFDVAAYDGAELLGRGRHRRAVVAVDKLRERVAQKIERLGEGIMTPIGIEANSGELPQLETLKCEVRGGVARVTLNRPKKNNAVNAAMTRDWESLVAWLAGHAEAARVVIIQGAGENFCAGDDVPEVGTLSPDDARALSLRQAEMYLAFARLPQPVIAAIDGFALGAGCVCAVSCDFRIATTRARLGMPEILLGWPPGYGLTQLTAAVGKAAALDLCLTGRQVQAEEARGMGLVNRVVPPMRLAAEVEQLASQLLACPARALRETKARLHADQPWQAGSAYLADTAAYIRCLQGSDAREGIDAFRAKRTAKFSEP
ncbi:MAG: enoyl-CoA hydratase/isomerase family protein [Planctomycetales bacterium]|nr:enoyl-CoA hydratase/isomerase family protein [Planctomycetales bacterium]